MRFHEWVAERSEKGLFDEEFTGRFTGEATESPFSGISYLYAEAVAEDPRQGNQSFTHTQNDLILLSGGNEIEISWRLIRPYLHASYRETLSADRFKDSQFVFRHLVEKDTTEIAIAEYGLPADRDYFLRLEREYYQLAPGTGSPEPSEKSNIVLAIREQSARGSSAELTPVFRQWSY